MLVSPIDATRRAHLPGAFLYPALCPATRERREYNDMASEEIVLAMFAIVGVAFTVIALSTSWLLSPKRPSAAKSTIYECGVDPIGPPWVQLRIGYYVFALLFVIFDIETAFFFPWAVIFLRPDTGLVVLWDMLFFVAVLVVGLAYAWKEGALKWR
jgi:NADH-quinone oxidoreductase subunit A